MNVIPVGDAPGDVSNYAKPPAGAEAPEQLEAWLRTMVKERAHNIHIPECLIQTVERISEEATRNGYKIMKKQLLGLTDQAEFFLKRTP